MSVMRARNIDRARPRRALIVMLASLSLVAGLTTVTAPPARAADDGVDDLLRTLGAAGADPTHNLAKWTSGLAGIGKLGEQLPLVAASAGGLLGYADLFEKAVTDELAGASDFGDLAVDKDISIDGGRTGHLTTTVSDEGAGKKLGIVVTVNRNVSAQDLHLASSNPKVDLTVSDGISVQLKSRFALSLVWTGAGDDKVYLVSGTGSPRLDVDATASIDTAAATAAVGILGVSLTGSTLDVKAPRRQDQRPGQRRQAVLHPERRARPGRLAGRPGRRRPGHRGLAADRQLPPRLARIGERLLPARRGGRGHRP